MGIYWCQKCETLFGPNHWCPNCADTTTDTHDTSLVGERNSPLTGIDEAAPPGVDAAVHSPPHLPPPSTCETCGRELTDEACSTCQTDKDVSADTGLL